MNEDRFRRIRELFDSVVPLPPGSREDFLRRACGADNALIAEVTELLAAHDATWSGLESPIIAAAPMAFHKGATLGSYEIVELLGVGGMGEVYRARDSKLKRDVAIKVLPEAFARDADRLVRFQREAEALAALNHPNIAAIYDLVRDQAARFLVMELVEGETLAERLKRGPVPLREALELARQIAEALESAHEKGIVHRDSKPANIKISADGKVKVLDFGLAKLREPESHEDPLRSPTFTSVPGMILGTAAYMSPEQAQGKRADPRSDVWAFGCVLYEMLTGSPAFEGETVGDILAEVLKGDPDWARLPTDTPSNIQRLLRRCLRKPRRDRLHSMADVRIVIEEALNEPDTGMAATPRRGARRERGLWAACVAVVAVIAVAAWLWVVPAAEQRLDIATGLAAEAASFELSPDGRRIVYEALDGNRSMLFLREFGKDAPTPLQGTGHALYPFWSPDGRRIGFFANGKLKVYNIETHTVDVLTNAVNGRGGTWNAEGTILYSQNFTVGLWSISIGASAGSPTEVTKLDGAGFHRFPHFLPDGHRFVYSVGAPAGSSVRKGIYSGDLLKDEFHRLVVADADRAFYDRKSGKLLFLLQQTLVAQDFDLDNLALKGNPLTVAADIVGLSASVSTDAGLLSYRRSKEALGVSSFGITRSGTRRLEWSNDTGTAMERAADPDPYDPLNPVLSHDGNYVALERTIKGNTDIYVLNLRSKVYTRVTTDPAQDLSPVWSSDDTEIVFQSNRGQGVFDLYRMKWTNPGSERLLVPPTGKNERAVDWHGNFVLVRENNPTIGYDLKAFSIDKGEWRDVATIESVDERDGQFSPDGKWVAYQAIDEDSDDFELWVVPFENPKGRHPITFGGGEKVRWWPDGRRLVYVGPDGLRSVEMVLAADGQSFIRQQPKPLFPARMGGNVQGIDQQQYMVSRDRRFLINALADEVSTPPITLIQNWNSKPNP